MKRPRELGIFDFIPEILMKATLEGEILELNTYGKKCLGLQDSKIPGTSLLEFVRPKRAWSELVQEIKERGAIQDFQLRWRSERHKQVILLISAAMVPADEGGPGYIVGLLRNLSDRSRLDAKILASRDRLRIILDAISEFILGVDRERRIVLANKAVANWLGLKVTDVIGLTLKEVFGGCPCCGSDGDSREKCPVESVFETGEPCEKKVRIVNEAGEERWFEQSAFPVLDNEGNINQVAVLLKDITEERRARKCIEQLNHELEQALKGEEKQNQALREALNHLRETQALLLESEKMASIGQLAAGVAHEINNPIGFISCNLGTLKTYCADLKAMLSAYREFEKEIQRCQCRSPECEAFVKHLVKKWEDLDLEFILEDLTDLIEQSLEGTERIKKIVFDLKEFSHVDHAALKRVDINKCLESALNMVRSELKSKVEIRREYGDLPLVLCYPQSINQVFMNLLMNAVQAIEDKGVVTITTRKVKQPREGVEIKISDTGKGIEEEIIHKIFDPFFTTKPVGKGTGLGLNVAYKIIKSHHGEIRVESTPGKGTSFFVFLPLLKEKDFLPLEAEMARDYDIYPVALWHSIAKGL